MIMELQWMSSSHLIQYLLRKFWMAKSDLWDLQAYFMQIDGTLNKLTTLREYIDDTEDYINIQLDNHRNQLIQLELVLSSATVVVAVYSLVAGIFGMNIPYLWNQNHSYVFKWVSWRFSFH
jgi:Mg2+ and Co2+ transporter CorA